MGKKIHSVSLDTKEVTKFQTSDSGSLSGFFNGLLIKFNSGVTLDETKDNKEVLTSIQQLETKIDDKLELIIKELAKQNELDASQVSS